MVEFSDPARAMTGSVDVEFGAPPADVLRALGMARAAHHERERLPVGIAFTGPLKELRPAPDSGFHQLWRTFDLPAAIDHMFGTLPVILGGAEAGAFTEASGVVGRRLFVSFGLTIGLALIEDGLVCGLELAANDRQRWPFESSPLDLRPNLIESPERLAKAMQEFLSYFVDELDAQDVVVGGAASEHWPDVESLLQLDIPVRAARYGDRASAIGAAQLANLRASD